MILSVFSQRNTRYRSAPLRVGLRQGVKPVSAHVNLPHDTAPAKTVFLAPKKPLLPLSRLQIQSYFIRYQIVPVARPNVINLSLLPRWVSLWRHSGESRNPVFSGLLDPGFRRGDDVGGPIPLKFRTLDLGKEYFCYAMV